MTRRGNTGNLIRAEDLTSEELRERARKGGKASAEARRRKKSMRESLEVLLSMTIGVGEKIDIEHCTSLQEALEVNLSVEQAMIVVQVTKALRGNRAAFESIVELLGEKVEVKHIQAECNNVNPVSVLTTEELKSLISQK